MNNLMRKLQGIFLEKVTLNFDQFKRFFFSGGTATLVHWMMMLTLIEMGITPALSTILGGLAGFCTNYLLQYYFVFGAVLPHYYLLPRYFIFAVVLTFINVSIFQTIYTVSLNIVTAQILATSLLSFISYICSRRYVFMRLEIGRAYER
ncbi:GtrA family protein [uncultured Methylophaga sp.]|uniref:GtrA family protein n=1 Tax=uncultured Methylophaga sp. TaxID=285271 RepID=UPI0023B6DE64|nr:GtrA family protein [uncultured Methylophaga sp.]|tara:strand:- start:2723 stop:3169 length:447 start_codon:yes stop_codon:yes gene_type:complete